MLKVMIDDAASSTYIKDADNRFQSNLLREKFPEQIGEQRQPLRMIMLRVSILKYSCIKDLRFDKILEDMTSIWPLHR